MALRIILVLGLGLHKLVWERLKRANGAPVAETKSQAKPVIRIVKLVKIAFLVGIIGQALLLPDFPAISESPSGLHVTGSAIYLAGLVLAVAGRLHLGDNWANLEDYQVIPEQKLVSKGVYGYIRHPIYTGDLLLLLGFELALNSWLVLGTVALFIVIVRQTLAEEAVLSRAFPGYEDYQRKTKMFIPYVL